MTGGAVEEASEADLVAGAVGEAAVASAAVVAGASAGEGHPHHGKAKNIR